MSNLQRIYLNLIEFTNLTQVFHLKSNLENRFIQNLCLNRNGQDSNQIKIRIEFHLKPKWKKEKGSIPHGLKAARYVQRGAQPDPAVWPKPAAFDSPCWLGCSQSMPRVHAPRTGARSLWSSEALGALAFG
jgi:hypothetical protein